MALLRDDTAALSRRARELREVWRKEGLSPRATGRFRRLVMAVYARHGRSFPWRETRDPYRILVSEFMLQQTQVDRVVPKYTAFLTRFPDLRTLAAAPLKEVLLLWQGLGYNRRAVNLHRAAGIIDGRYGGVPPRETEDLLALPGVGQSTAGALRAFGWGLPSVFIETNIRRVFLHVFFPRRSGVADGELLPLVAKTIDRRNPRTWYYALMDYGTFLAAGKENPNVRSRHYVRQGAFRGSDRQIRGAILRALLAGGPQSVAELGETVRGKAARVRRLADNLVAEGLLRKRNGKYMAG